MLVIAMDFENINNEVILHLENSRHLLTSPIKHSERIKYTSFAVSKNFVIFGATSGGLYVFKRNPYTFWQLIPSKESIITFLSISSSENFIAFATNKNIICILELNEQINSKLVTRTDDLVDTEITALCWNDDVHKPTLYIGDAYGRVSLLKLSFLSKSILQLPTNLSMTLDSRIVQLCCQNDFLLVSTMTRCFLCDILKEQFKQIGNQLRDGLYGATFMTTNSNVKVFCARPGSRLWEVDLNSVVHSTHQFKKPLAIPPTPFISIFNEPQIIEVKSSDVVWQPQSFNFINLYDLLGSFIVTYKRDALYIFNIETVDVLFWNNCFGNIVSVQCVSNSIFVWNTDGDLHELVVLPINKCLLNLYFKKHHDLCLTIIHRLHDKLIAQHTDTLKELSPLCDLEHSHIADEQRRSFLEFKEKVNLCASKNVKLNSGIHVVNNRYFSSLLLDDNKLTINHQPRSPIRSDSDEAPKRSLSLPSNLKKDENESVENMNGFANGNRFNEYTDEKFPNYDTLYLEMGLYRSPFITAASYKILEEGLSDLKNSFSEKFSEGSSNLKQKWKIVENKVKFLSNTKNHSESNKFTDTNVNNYSSNGNGIAVSENIENIAENFEPVVQLKYHKSTEIDVDYAKIIELCNQEEDSRDVFEFLNFVVGEYNILGEKHGIHKYEQFPFSLPEKALVRAKKMFQEFLTKESLLKWFEHEKFSIRIDDNFTNIYPPLLLEFFSEQELRLDFLLCKTLIIFTEIMKSSNILETIKSFHFPCYYMSFCYVMKYFQNSEILERNNFTKGDSIHWPVPVYLNTMLLMISLDQIDVFCEMGLKKNIDVNDVIYLMFHLDHTEETSFKDKYKYVCLKYLEKQCERRDFILLDDAYVVSLAVKMVMFYNKKADVCCNSCWFLLPELPTYQMKFLKLAKHLLKYLWDLFQSSCSGTNLHSKRLLLTIRRSINEMSEYDPYLHPCYKNNELCEHIMCARIRSQIERLSEDTLLSFNIICSFCCRLPELWKYVCEFQKDSHFKILYAEHFIQLGSMTEIESVFLQMTEEDAKMLLALKSKLSDGFCLNCGSKILISGNGMKCNDLTSLILRRLGAKSTLQILGKFSGNIRLEKSFYQSVVLSAIPGINSDLRDAVISAVSSQYNMMPVSKKVSESLVNALKVDRPDKEVNLKTSDVHHWGMTISMEESNQAICHCCSLPLLSKYFIKEDNGGIMVFSCSHTYHTICLKNKDSTATCLVCDRFLR